MAHSKRKDSTLNGSNTAKTNYPKELLARDYHPNRFRPVLDAEDAAYALQLL